MSSTIAYRIWQLPWDTSRDQDDAFSQLLKRVVPGILLFALLLSVLPVPQPEVDEVPELPERYAELILEKKAEPPPPPPEPVVLPEQEPEPVPVVEEKPQPEPEPEVVEPPKPSAEERASVAGLLPFADDLADLRDNEIADDVANQRPVTGAVGDAPRTERSIITTAAASSSGGISTDALSRDTGGTTLSGHNTTEMKVPVSTAAGNAVAAAKRQNSAARSREEIEKVFDQNKGAIYALYTRALRRDPGLEGKLVLKFTIEPSGVISSCEIVSSELDDQELERKLVQRVKLFKFQAKDVATVTTTKPIDFFPA